MTFGGRTIAELAALPLTDLAGLLDGGSETARVLTADLRSRIAPVVELGLGYLSLDRAAPTLSPGELQRLRLATQLRSGLFGVVYVLDEPSAGLHPADTEALLTVLERLKAAGNSVFVVEHHLEVVRGADWVVDVGPGAGEHGGRVLYRRTTGRAGLGRGVGHGRVPLRRVTRAGPRDPTAAGMADGGSGDPAQPARGDGRVPGRRAHRGHRGLPAPGSPRSSAS